MSTTSIHHYSKQPRESVIWMSTPRDLRPSDMYSELQIRRHPPTISLLVAHITWLPSSYHHHVCCCQSHHYEHSNPIYQHNHMVSWNGHIESFQWFPFLWGNCIWLYNCSFHGLRLEGPWIPGVSMFNSYFILSTVCKMRIWKENLWYCLMVDVGNTSSGHCNGPENHKLSYHLQSQWNSTWKVGTWPIHVEFLY